MYEAGEGSITPGRFPGVYFARYLSEDKAIFGLMGERAGSSAQRGSGT